MNITMLATVIYVVFSVLILYTVDRPSNRKRVLHYMLTLINRATSCLGEAFNSERWARWSLAALALLLGFLFVAA